MVDSVNFKSSSIKNRSWRVCPVKCFLRSFACCSSREARATGENAKKLTAKTDTRINFHTTGPKLGYFLDFFFRIRSILPWGPYMLRKTKINILKALPSPCYASVTNSYLDYKGRRKKFSRLQNLQPMPKARKGIARI